MEKIAVRKLRANAQLPTYGSAGAGGADLYPVGEAVTIALGDGLYPTGLAMEIPLAMCLIYAAAAWPANGAWRLPIKWCHRQ